jgi:pimeloyl-ACP methyl ester carboxylesterase
MDGTGQLLHTQTEGLERAFDVRCLAIPPDDLTRWDDLTEQLTALVRTELDGDFQRPVYLCGESFGGCLAMKAVLRSPDLFHRLILINPASSFNRRLWMNWGSYLTHVLPEPIYRLSCLSLLPFLAALERIEASDRRALITAMQSVSYDSSVWRISLLREFFVSDRQLRQMLQPTIVIASGSDRLLPSVSEAEYLVSQLPNAQTHILPMSGHACLLESDVNLYQILQINEFVEQAELRSPIVYST